MKHPYCADCVYDMFGSGQFPCKCCINGDLKSKVQKLKSCSTCVHDGTGDSACLTCYDYEKCMYGESVYRNYEEKTMIDPFCYNNAHCQGCIYNGNQLLSTQCSVCLASGHYVYYRTWNINGNTKGDTRMNQKHNLQKSCLDCYFSAESAFGPHCKDCVRTGSHSNWTPKAARGVIATKVILNPPATILIFDDGSKTVVKCMDGDEYDAEKGVALALLKRILGYKDYRKVLKDVKELVEEQNKKEIEEAKKTLEAENRVRLMQAETLKKLKDNGVTFH